MADNVERSYLAGIMDGEGCIGLTKKNNGYPNCYRYYIQITNSCLLLLEWIQEKFGGRIRRMHHSTYAIEWTSREDIIRVLEQVAEFLIVKEQEALAMIDFCYTPSSYAEDRALQQAFVTSSKHSR